MSNVSILGTGAMGARMAAALLRAGHDVTVWNRTAAKTEPLAQAGARVAESPRQAAKGAEFVIVMATDDDASRAIWLDEESGALAGMAGDAVAIESSTLTVDWARQLAAACGARGVAFLDAPVAGSRPQAEAGQLIYLVGGEAVALEEARPLLEAMGGAVHHAGPVGAGTAVKLAVNTLFGVQLAALGELLGFLTRCGLDGAGAIEILGATPVMSPAAKGAAVAMVAGNFAPQFPLALVEKDFRYALESAGAVQARTPLAAATRTVYKAALDAGHGGDNITGISQLYR